MLRTIRNFFTRGGFGTFNLDGSNDVGDYKTSVYYTRAGNIKADKVGAVEYISTSPDGETENESSIILGFLENIFNKNGIKELAQNFVRSRDDWGVFIAKKLRMGEDGRGQIIGLQVLNPQDLEISLDGGQINKIEYIDDKGARTTVEGEDELADYIIKPTNENNYNWGESCDKKDFVGNVKKLQTLLDLEVNVRNLELSSIQRNVNINGFFSFKDRLDKEQMKEFKKKVVEEHRGTNKGNGFIIGSDFDFKQYDNPALSHNDFLEKIEADIFTAKGVPELLSSGTQGSQFYAGRQTIQLFYDMTILPEIEEFVKMLNTEIVPEFELENTEKITYLNPIPPDVDTAMQNVPNLVGTIISQNEARARIGEPPLQDARADEVVFPGEEFDTGATPFKTAEKVKRSAVKNRKKYMKKLAETMKDTDLKIEDGKNRRVKIKVESAEKKKLKNKDA